MPEFQVLQPEEVADKVGGPSVTAAIANERLRPLIERLTREEVAAVYQANDNPTTVRALGLSTEPESRGIAELYGLLNHYGIERKHQRRPRSKVRRTTPKDVVDGLTPAKPEATATRAEIEMAKALYPLLRPMILRDLRGALTLAEAV